MRTRVSPDDSNLLHIPLLKEEDARYASNTGISSANFYKGDINEAYNALQSKMKEVLRANPWISSIVKPLSKIPRQTKKQILISPALKGKIGVSVLEFHKTIQEKDIDTEVDSILIIEDRIDSQLQRDSPYRHLAAACQSDSRVVPNRSGLYKGGQKVTKITLVPVSNDEFCVVFAMSHLIADGDTYFKVMTMLSTKKAESDERFLFGIDKLDPNRQFDFRTIEQTAIGFEEWKFMSSLTFIKVMIQGVMTKPKKVGSKPGSEEPSGLRIRANFIDKGKVDAQKQMYKDTLKGTAGNAVTNLFKKKTEDVEFISTQDIITSSWFNASSSRLPMFTLNLRERRSKLSKNLAGNYETSIVLDPPSYANASLIRKSLQGECFRRANPMPVPGFCGKTGCAFITTWCFTVEGKAAGLHLENCAQLLHMPIMPVSILKMCPMDFAVVFNATIDSSASSSNSKQAILMFCKEASDEELRDNTDSVLGDVVNTNIFHDPS